jgi:replicative DNA helicase
VTEILLDRPLPQNPDAERAVLGSVLLSRDAYYRVVGLVEEGDFYKEPNRRIFAVMRSLADKNEPLDTLTVRNELVKRAELESIGGSAYVASLTDMVPDIANVERYATIVREESLRRQVIIRSNVLVRAALNRDDSASELAAKASATFADFTRSRIGPQSIRDIAKRGISRLDARITSNKWMTGLPLGLPALDSYTLGLQRGVLSVLGSRPRVGKTALCLAAIVHNLREGRRVMFVELDMSESMIEERLLAAISGVEYYKVRTGRNIHKQEMDAIAEAQREQHYFGDRLLVDHETRAIMAIAANVRRACRNGGVDLLVLDHIGHVDGGRGEKRYIQVGDISNRLIAIAHESNAATLILTQLNRDAHDREPSLADIRESGSIEQDARLVLLLDRPHFREPEKHECYLRILVPKNEGEAGHVHEAHFDLVRQRITQEADEPCRYCGSVQSGPEPVTQKLFA